MKNIHFKEKLSLLAILLVPLLVAGAFIRFDSRVVQAAPGSPGVPEAPVLIYNEDFENNPVASPVRLIDYVGSDGMTYTADNAWRNNCNGEVLFFAMHDDEFDGSGSAVGPGSNCSVGNGTNATMAFDAVRRLAYALGTITSNPTNNRALTAYTDAGNVYVDPGANLVQFQTQQNINLPNNTRRFVISRLDTAAINCTWSGTVQQRLVFNLLDNSEARRINQQPINACTNSGATTVTPPGLQSNGAIAENTGSIRVGSFMTDSAILSNSSAIGIQLINLEGGGQGNDNAIDNIQISDASPKLDKAFSPDTVMVGETSKMTFTVTNTSDLLAKEGWSFTDNLPENLQIAQTPAVETDCPNGVVTATAGGSSVEYSGDLTEGMTSCTLSVMVTSSVAGTYTNGPANLVDVVGLYLPADAQVTFVPKAPDTGNKSSHLAVLYTGIGVGVIGAGALVRKKLKTLKR
jgi:uncharacterized repeat protein (TIGR01451 family)